MPKKQTDLPIIIAVDDLDAAVDTYTRLLGYKLEMITPADSPTVAVLSSKDLAVRLEKRPANASEPLIPKAKTKNPHYSIISRASDASKWVTGRAGMEYRDLIPGRLGGRVIASHIRIPNGGEVADYVHYHKVRFQMIYCVAGAIRVVYEDQGEAFWLKPGDCVLQPPEIRHRVIEAEANSEVVEIGMPAVHETWVDHDTTLPTGRVLPDREFSGQLFVRHIAADAEWNEGEFDGFELRDTGILAATEGLARVIVTRPFYSQLPTNHPTLIHWAEFLFLFVLVGKVAIRTHDGDEYELTSGDSCVIPPGLDYRVEYLNDAELLEVSAGSILG